MTNRTSRSTRQKAEGAAAIAAALGITQDALKWRRYHGWYDDIIHRAANGRVWAYMDDLTRRRVEEEHA